MKAEVKITITRVIELDPSIYDNAQTPEEILKQEIQFAEDLPHEWMDSEDAEWTTSGRLLPAEVGMKPNDTNTQYQERRFGKTAGRNYTRNIKHSVRT